MDWESMGVGSDISRSQSSISLFSTLVVADAEAGFGGPLNNRAPAGTYAKTALVLGDLGDDLRQKASTMIGAADQALARLEELEQPPEEIASVIAALQRPSRELARSLAVARNTVAAAYAELQVTSNFSFLRGASHPDELVYTAAELGRALVQAAEAPDRRPHLLGCARRADPRVAPADGAGPATSPARGRSRGADH